MSSYNYSYNVLINRLEAFAAGHFLIKRFTHGQIDLADDLQDDQYPFMHVVPERIVPVDGGMQFDFLIMFADIPRDKEYKAEYQREVISDCVRLGQDLIAEVKNGLQLFGFDVQLTNNPTFEPFMEEYKNTITGVTFTLSLEVPWDWSACDIPAVWSVGGSSTGGSGTGYGITLQTNGVNNALQNLLNLEAGANITITDNGNGTITIDSTGGGGGNQNLQQVTDVGNSTTNDIEFGAGAGILFNNGARVEEGTTNGGLGGVNGVALKCSIDYELKWEAGRLYVMEQNGFTIREVSHTFNDAPSVNDDDSLGYVIGSRWILDNGSVYTCSDATTGAAVWLLESKGSVTSVGLSVPSPANAALSVSGSPVTTSGTLAISANGTSSEYIDGTGALQTFPTITPQVNADWNATSGVAEILNKPTLATVATTGDYNDLINTPAPPTPQGLQDVITTDNTLTVNNTIQGDATNLLWNNNTEFKIYPGALGFFEVSVGKYPPSKSVLYATALYASMRTQGATTQEFKTDTTAIYVKTPNVGNATAVNGQVLTLADATTGRVEYTTPSAATGTVTSVGLTMPTAFSVTGSPVTTSGTLAVSGAGTSAQYVDGTGALQTFPALTGFVPYTGATQDVDLGINKLSTKSVYITGTAGNGHIHMKHQSADATATGQSTALWADTNGDIKWKNDGNYKTTLKTSSNTADHVYTFPNETAELMPRNAAITGATKTKITYDSDGLITAGADLAATDIPSGIDATKIGSGVVSNTEFGYLDGVTSAIQTQFSGKQDTLVSGTNIKTVNSNSLVGSGNVSVGTVTSVGGTGTVAGISLSGTVTGSGNLTLAGTLAVPIANITATGTPSATTYLRGDGSWATIASAVSSSVYAANPNTSQGAGTTAFWSITGSAASNTTESTRQVPIPIAGTLKNLYIRLGAAQSSGGTLVFTLRKNGVNTGITITFSNADGSNVTKSDTTNTVSVVAGDLITLQAVNNAAGSASGTVISMSLILQS